MIERVIEWSIRHRLGVVVATLILAALGLQATRLTPIDALPDLGENQIAVYADWPGRGPQEVETQITQPLSLSLQGIAGMKTARATSMSDFALIHLIFGDEVDRVTARQRVRERLYELRGKLPAGVEPALGPEATGLGWVYQYYLEPGSAKAGMDLGRLRSLHDSLIRPQLSGVPGVAEVAGVGGFVRQYQIEVDSLKLSAAGLSLGAVMDAVSRSHLSVGGKTVEENGMEFVVRGLALVRGTSDLESITLPGRNGAGIRLKDIARVEIGGDYRRGVLDVAGREVVGGIVVMRSGENGREVIRRVKDKIALLQRALPEGVTIKPFYDRGALIDRGLATLKRALTEEVLLVILAHVIFLWHFRSVLIVTLPLPIAILVSFLGMRAVGQSANIMSLSGIVMAIGVLVDGAIVVTENVIRRCAGAESGKGSKLEETERARVVLEAAREVGRPVFFAMAIIVLAFVPVFAFTGREGRLFLPLAWSKTLAVAGAAVLSVTLVPALCRMLVRGPFPGEERNRLMSLLLRAYDPMLRFALRNRATVLGSAACVLAAAVLLARGMGSEFMPPLNEGSLLFMPTFVPGTSLGEMKRVMAWQDQVFASVSEIERAVGKLGRADTATDPAPVEMIETTITLKPEAAWRPGMTRQGLVDELTNRLSQVPGGIPGFLQPIQGRMLMVATGIRAQLGVKIFGDDLGVLESWAGEVERVVRDVRGATGVASSRVQGRPYFEIEADRAALARHGFSAQEVLDVVEAGIGGREVAMAFENRSRIPVQVRFQRSDREDLERLGALPVTNAQGKTLPLGQLAALRRVEGPNEIASENGRLRVFVQANLDPATRDLGSWVAEIKRRVESEIRPRLPAGVTLEFSGEHEDQTHAAATLRLVVPCVVLIIFLLLCQVYRDAAEAAHVLLAIPFALSGGVFFQFLFGIPFSVAVWVGYIALFGTAIQTAVVMVLFLQDAANKRRAALGGAFGERDLLEAVREGARLRLRPKLMTVATIVASLLPVLWSTQSGAEIMRPVAVPVVGGMISSLVHILIVTPVCFFWVARRRLRAVQARA